MEVDALRMGFAPKVELHITMIGYSAGRIITDILNNVGSILHDRFMSAVQEYQDSLSNLWFTIDKGNDLRIITKQYSSGMRTSLIYMVDRDNAMTRLHHKLDALFPGIKEHLPIPHITIGVHGDSAGIGLTQHVWDNELLSNFLVGNPEHMTFLGSKLSDLQDRVHQLERDEFDTHNCDRCDGQCTGGCDPTPAN